MVYYHSSDLSPTIGTVFQGRGDAYKSEWESTSFYNSLELYRPKDKTAHKDAVFVCNDLESLQYCGGLEETILILKIEGGISWHDMNWSTEISSLVSDGILVENRLVREASENYWSGKPHTREPLWEGIARKAIVVAVFDYNQADFLIDAERDRLTLKFQRSVVSQLQNH